MDEKSLYPSIYQARLSRQVLPLLKVSALALLAFLGRAQLTFATPISAWAFAIGLMLLGSLRFINEGKSCIVLHADRIEKTTWFGTRSWRRAEVARVKPGLLYAEFMLVHKHDRASFLTIPAGIERDAAWNAWLRDVPEQEKTPSLFDRVFGPLPSERSRGMTADARGTPTVDEPPKQRPAENGLN